MPPPLSRPSISGLQAALSSCRISTTTTKTRTSTTTSASCASSTSPWRASFSTTSTPFAASSGVTRVPPQSPKYIQLPEPPQSSESKPPRVRGHLPVPRKIFRASDGHLKVQSGYVERIMPLSAAEKAGAPPKSEQEERRRRMAAARRSALAAGLQGLYVRKVARERRLARRAAAHREANLAAATAPERIDDVLTRPSVRLATAEQVAVQLDPDRFIKADQARKKHAAKLAREAEARGDALAQLYVAAKDFIVDEAELEQRIETLFTADYHRHGGLNKGISIWDVHHAPISVNELRAELMGQSSEKILDRHKAPSTRTAERQKTVAEELTGGKLV